MGQAYAAAFRALERPFLAVGRGAASARAFEEATGHAPRLGGLAALLAEPPHPRPTAAVIAVPVDDLAATAETLLHANVKHLLIEKPAGVDAAECRAIADAAARHHASAFVAFNRRFYDSVTQARRIIDDDGGPTSIDFEFTEVSDVIAASAFTPRVKAHWVLANSAHVIDTAVHLAGEPVELAARTSGSLAWHPAAARFAGMGVTDRGALLSYHADWDAPGRWGIDVMTRRHRLILRPMEKLAVQKRGSFDIEPRPAADDADTRCKPGILRQTEAFLRVSEGHAADARLVPIADHARRAAGLYHAIASGTAFTAARATEAPR